MFEIVRSYMNGHFSVICDRKFRLLSNQAAFKQIVSHTVLKTGHLSTTQTVSVMHYLKPVQYQTVTLKICFV